MNQNTVEAVQGRLQTHIDNFRRDVEALLKDDGDTSETSQRMHILNRVLDVEHAVNGIAANDLSREVAQSILLKPFHVSLHAEPGDKFTTIFPCLANNAEHAYEQAEDAYPGAELLCAVEVVLSVHPVRPAAEEGAFAALRALEKLRRDAADQALAEADFGDYVRIVDTGGWEWSGDSASCSLYYVHPMNDPEMDSVLGSFTVEFEPGSAKVINVFSDPARPDLAGQDATQETRQDLPPA